MSIHYFDDPQPVIIASTKNRLHEVGTRFIFPRYVDTGVFTPSVI